MTTELSWCRLCSHWQHRRLSTCQNDNICCCHSWQSWHHDSCQFSVITLQWHHNEHDGVSNHLCLNCLLNHLFRHRSKKTLKLSVTGLCAGNPLVPGGFSSQRPVTCNIFPFDDVIMIQWIHRLRRCKEHRDDLWRVSCQKGPNRHAYACQVGPFWQDTLVVQYDLCLLMAQHHRALWHLSTQWWPNLGITKMEMS